VFPPYTADKLCEPNDSELVIIVALPLASDPVPIDVPPSKNVTVPPGVPEADWTDAVNVTGWPHTADEAGVVVNVVVVVS
jgi:hypothetical protein